MNESKPEREDQPEVAPVFFGKPPATRRQKIIRWLRRIVVAMLVATLLYVASAYLKSYMTKRGGEKKLDEVSKRLDADFPGWRMEELIEKHNELVGPEPTSKAVLIAELGQEWELRKLFDDMKSRPHFRANNVLLDDSNFAKLDRELAKLENGIVQLLSIPEVKNPGYRVGIKKVDFDDPIDLQGVVKLLSACDVMYWDICRALHKHRQADISKQIIASKRIVECFGEPTALLFMSLHRRAWDTFGKTLRSSLALGWEGDPKLLQEFQQFFWVESQRRLMAKVLVGELAGTEVRHRSTMANKGDTILFKQERDGDLYDQFVAYQALANFPMAAAHLLEHHRKVIELFQQNPENREYTQPSSLPRVQEIYFNLLCFSEKFAIEIEPLHRAGCLSMASALACERYRRDNGAWPKALKNLVGEYLPAVPNDPFAVDQSMKYVIDDEGVLIYSVGPNGIDDGGQIDPGAGKTSPDIGVRLWRPELRRRPAEKVKD